MSDQGDQQPEKKLSQDWNPAGTGSSIPPLFLPDEIDIYVNKMTNETFFFHGKEIDYPNLDHLEYDPILYTVDVCKKDGTRQNLGVKIQWMIRPYLTKVDKVNVVRTKNGESIDGVTIPLIIKDKKP